MAGLDIKLDDAQFASVIGKAILDEMSPAAKDKIIADAIVALNKVPEGRGYGYDKPVSPLQQAFNQAVSGAAFKIVRETVEAADGPVRAKIKEAVDGFITIFPDWQSPELQAEIMALIVKFSRERAEAR